MASDHNKCLFCGERTARTILDLGTTPLCESFVHPDRFSEPEPIYPLVVNICMSCLLVQLEEQIPPESIFTEYAYFSSYAPSWMEHAKAYCAMATQRFGLNEESFVVELASNDGYLLRNFVAAGIPCLGIDPAANVALAATESKVPTLVEFFGSVTARKVVSEGKQADLIIGNNVLAQIPDLRDFVLGVKLLLREGGTATFEFPHVLKLLAECQYDTIYHEHYWYFSLLAIGNVFSSFGLRLFDVEELSTHGGSLRIYICHENDTRQVSPQTEILRRKELDAGIDTISAYEDFGEQVRESKRALLTCLIALKRNGKSIAGYGAPGKGNTLLNYCGIGTDFIDFTVDRNPYKHGRYLPESRIPVFEVDEIRKRKPDYLLILPWNLRKEIMEQMKEVREWGCRFIVPIPTAKVYE